MMNMKRIGALALCIMTVLPFTCALAALAASPAFTVAESPTDLPATMTDLPAQTPTVTVTPTQVEPIEPPAPPESPVSTRHIQSVCQRYDLTPDKYWSVKESGGGNCSSVMGTVASALTGSDHPVNGGGYKSYNYMNQYECHGFACYVMAKVVTELRGCPTEAVPRTGDHSGWIKLLPHQVTDLRVGDIVRVEGASYQHTAVVYAVDENGRAQFLESGGSNACRIRLGMGFNHDPSLDTLERITDRYCLEYVYRYTGE